MIIVFNIISASYVANRIASRRSHKMKFKDFSTNVAAARLSRNYETSFAQSSRILISKKMGPRASDERHTCDDAARMETRCGTCAKRYRSGTGRRGSGFEFGFLPLKLLRAGESLTRAILP